jgi:succinate-acetate transporter protein
MWGLFTAFMFIATLKLNRGLQIIFLSLVILFWLLAAHNFWETGVTESPIILRIAGWVGIFCGASAIYVSIAEVLNEVYGKMVLPIGPSHL